MREEVPSDAHRFLAAIERAAQRAERLISDLLEANAIENGSLSLESGKVDAGAIVRQAAVEHEQLVRESGAATTVSVPPAQVLIVADRDRILQVLANLIGNAVKHARGTPIDLELQTTATDAVFTVRDRGAGIAPGELAHVFDRYGSGRVKRGGAGLGLSIARGIVSIHNGTIAAANRPGGGAELRFTIPLAATAD